MREGVSPHSTNSLEVGTDAVSSCLHDERARASTFRAELGTICRGVYFANVFGMSMRRVCLPGG